LKCCCWLGLILDAVDEEEMIVVLTLSHWWSQRGLGAQWGEAQEQEGLHQISSVGAILANAQNNTVAIQLLLGELQERKERLLAGFVRQCLGQSDI